MVEVQKRLLTADFTFDRITVVTTRLLRKSQSAGGHKEGISLSEKVAVVQFFLLGDQQFEG